MFHRPFSRRFGRREKKSILQKSTYGIFNDSPFPSQGKGFGDGLKKPNNPITKKKNQHFNLTALLRKGLLRFQKTETRNDKPPDIYRNLSNLGQLEIRSILLLSFVICLFSYFSLCGKIFSPCKVSKPQSSNLFHSGIAVKNLLFVIIFCIFHTLKTALLSDIHIPIDYKYRLIISLRN
jgi:hypothetical protein